MHSYNEISVSKIYRLLSALFILSLPMMPVFTRNGYYILGLLTFLISSIIFINKKDKLSSLEIMELIFTLLIAYSLIYTISKEYTTQILSLNIRLLIFSFAAIRLVLYCTKNEEIMIEFIGKYYVLGTILVSIYAFFYEHGKHNADNRFGGLLFGGQYGTYIFYSYSLFISISFLTFVILVKKHKSSKKNILYLVYWIFIVFCIFINGTRKVLIELLIFGAISIVLLYGKKPKKIIQWTIISIVTLIIAYFVIMNNEYLYESIGERIVSFFNYMATGEKVADASAFTRNQMRDTAWILFRQNPIGGIGANSFIKVFGDTYGIYLYSHNNFLELLSNQGIIGFTIYYGWYLYMLMLTLKLAKKRDVYACGMFAFLVTELVLDFGTVSYMREHFILIYNMISVYCLYKIRINNDHILKKSKI